jgi:trehalose 6-phosphate phosphatase
MWWWAPTKPEAHRRLLAPFLSSPQTSGLFTDFDGTLSEIVQVPSEARPLEGVTELLARLARSYRVVAVVSGRSAAELLEWLGTEVEIWGTHGVERTRDGEVELSSEAAPYQELMARVAEEARSAMEEAGLEGATVEDKRVVLGLHYRQASDRGGAQRALERLAADLASRHNLVVATGKASFELRPPVELSKRAVLERRARELELTAAAFVGDDVGDLPAYDALDALGDEGLATLRVAVDSEEAPEELLQRADIVLQGPAEVVELLKRLAG